MSTLRLNNVNKIYDENVKAVDSFNLTVEKGEFIVLVGPSGCGKSTTLRMVAGLEEVSSGELLIGDEIVNDMAPKDRDIAMVFQNYALYSHMTVYHNMAFSLTLRRSNKDLIHERILWAADMLGLTPYLNRKPNELSGGQRQRVALGRAMVRQPKIFLFDEPLSNLDAKLRNQMRRELKLLHHKLNTTMIYVTHDQIEALTLADRIVIMDKGVIQQVGTPIQVYKNPSNVFVAKFIGTPAMNMFEAEVDGEGSIKELNIKNNELSNEASKIIRESHLNKKIYFGVRPEHINLEKKSNEDKNANLFGKVISYELLGYEAIAHLDTKIGRVIAKVNVRQHLKTGDEVAIYFDLNQIRIFDYETERNILLK